MRYIPTIEDIQDFNKREARKGFEHWLQQATDGKYVINLRELAIHERVIALEEQQEMWVDQHLVPLERVIETIQRWTGWGANDISPSAARCIIRHLRDKFAVPVVLDCLREKFSNTEAEGKKGGNDDE